MGFFGMFNYNKDGPGVDKDAPPKKRFLLYFDVLVRKFWNIIRMNLLFIGFNIPAIAGAFFVSFTMLQNLDVGDDTYNAVIKVAFMTFIMIFPVVTTGPAQAGFTYVMRNFAREEHAFLWGDFKDAAKRNFKQSLIVSIIDFIIMAVFAIDIVMYSAMQAESTFYLVANAFMIIAFIIFLMMHMYIYPMMVTFKLTIFQIYKNAIIFALLKFLPNLGILAFGALITFATMMVSPFASPVFFLFVNFGLMGFTTNFYVYPYLKKYINDRYEESQKKTAIKD